MIARISAVVCVIAAAWAAYLYLHGGYDARILGIRIRSNDPSRLLYVSVAAALVWLGIHGVGRALIDQLVGMARDVGRSRVVLDVAASNPRAEALYRRAGFKVVGERKSRLANERGRVPDHRRMERIID